MKRLLQNYFYEASINLISKSDKHTSKTPKLQMNIDVEILKKIPASQIEIYIYHDKSWFYPGNAEMFQLT